MRAEQNDTGQASPEESSGELQLSSTEFHAAQTEEGKKLFHRAQRLSDFFDCVAIGRRAVRHESNSDFTQRD
jgi:hypothetical protein